MRVLRLHQLNDCLPHRAQWDRLAGDCVFRTWRWLSTWWKHYGPTIRDQGGELRILLVLRDATRPGEPAPLAAVLPTYVASDRLAGRTLRLLGDGEACSDHVGLLANPSGSDDAIVALVDALRRDGDWDLLDFAAVDHGDVPTRALVDGLRRGGCTLDEQIEPSCWKIMLPGDWDQFLAMQSKSHRKQLRRLDSRVLQTDACQWRQVESAEELDAAWPILVDLHQRRRRSLGEPGCFSLPSWAKFHRDVAAELLAAGELRLSWLELHGRPVAAEYHLARGKSVFAYQGGLDPEAAADEPGRLSLTACLQHAIAEGRASFDLLRGDEPYKPHWRAEPQGVSRLLATPRRAGPQTRRHARRAVRAAKRLAKQALRRLT